MCNLKLCFAILALPFLLRADTIDTCVATATDLGGNVTPVTCRDNTAILGSHINLLSDGTLSAGLLNYTSGDATADIPGSAVSVALYRETSASGEFLVSGGSGGGEIVLQGGSDNGSDYVFGGGNVSLTPPVLIFTSNFLPTPAHYPGFPGPYYVPFTFNVPFELDLFASITLSDTATGYVSWEAIQQYQLRSVDVIDANGNSVKGAAITDPPGVPEPTSLLLMLTVVAILGARKRWPKGLASRRQ